MDQPSNLDTPTKLDLAAQPDMPTKLATLAKLDSSEKIDAPAKPDKPIKPDRPVKIEELAKMDTPTESTVEVKPDALTKPDRPAKPDKPIKMCKTSTLDTPTELEGVADLDAPLKPNKPPRLKAKPDAPTKPDRPTRPDKLIRMDNASMQDTPTQLEEVANLDPPSKPNKSPKPEVVAKPDAPKRPGRPTKPDKLIKMDEISMLDTPLKLATPAKPDTSRKLDALAKLDRPTKPDSSTKPVVLAKPKVNFPKPENLQANEDILEPLVETNNYSDASESLDDRGLATYSAPSYVIDNSEKLSVKNESNDHMPENGEREFSSISNRSFEVDGSRNCEPSCSNILHSVNATREYYPGSVDVNHIVSVGEEGHIQNCSAENSTKIHDESTGKLVKEDVSASYHQYLDADKPGKYTLYQCKEEKNQVTDCSDKAKSYDDKQKPNLKPRRPPPPPPSVEAQSDANNYSSSHPKTKMSSSRENEHSSSDIQAKAKCPGMPVREAVDVSGRKREDALDHCSNAYLTNDMKRKENDRSKMNSNTLTDRRDQGDTSKARGFDLEKNVSSGDKAEVLRRSPAVKRDHRADGKNSKSNRNSYPVTELMSEHKEEIKLTIENNWKCKSLVNRPQAVADTGAKAELLKRFEERRNKAEEDSNVMKSSTHIKKAGVSVIKEEVDEAMEDAVLFDYVLVVKLKEGENGLEPYISFRFPPKQHQEKEEDSRLASIPQFCFPDLKTGMHTADYLLNHIGFGASETFSFVLTDMVGHRHFGYCRQIQVEKRSKGGTKSGLPEVYCIVSPYGLFSLYSQILDEVERQCACASSSAFVFLKAVLSHSLPKAGRSITVNFYSGLSGGLSSFKLKRDSDTALHEHVDLSYLFAKLPVTIVLKIVCNLLLERRIIVASSQLSLLSSCCHGFISLLYPFVWQHTYIPVLPFRLVDMCCLPTPYLLGVLSGCLEEIHDLPIDEAIIVDLDTGKILRDDEQQKIGSFPAQTEKQMDASLRKVIGESASHSNEKKERNMMFSEMFVDGYLNFIGHFKDYYSDCPEDYFQTTEFYRATKSKEIKNFLKEFVKTQAFQQFIRSYENETKSEGLFERMFLAWQNSRKNRVSESAWHKFKGKLKTAHR